MRLKLLRKAGLNEQSRNRNSGLPEYVNKRIMVEIEKWFEENDND